MKGTSLCLSLNTAVEVKPELPHSNPPRPPLLSTKGDGTGKVATRGVSDCLLEGSEPVSRINFMYDTTEDGLVLHLSRKADDGGGSDEDDGCDGEGGGESDDSKIKRLNDTIEQLECEADQDARGRLGGSSDADVRESKEGKGIDIDGDSSELASDIPSTDEADDNDEEEKTGGYERPVAAFAANPAFSGKATGPNIAVPVATALTPRLSDDDIVTLRPVSSSRRRVVVTLGFVPVL